MSTKLNPEEIAAKMFPARGEEIEYGISWREAAKRTIREVAQPLADERDAYRDALKKWSDRFEYEADNKHVEALVNETSAILAKYKKP